MGFFDRFIDGLVRGFIQGAAESLTKEKIYCTDCKKRLPDVSSKVHKGIPPYCDDCKEKRQFHRIPLENNNVDPGSVSGFRSGYHKDEIRSGKIFNDGTNTSIHIHSHPDGMTISEYELDEDNPGKGKVKSRYNFNTGKDETP